MYFTGLSAVDQLEKVNELPANLIAVLLRVLGVEHMREHRQEMVLRIQAGRGGVLWDDEQSLESAEKLEVLWGEIDGRVLNEEAGGEGSIAEDRAR